MSSLVCVADYEKAAEEKIPKNSLDFYRSGAGDEYSLGWNKKAFKKYRIRPKFFRDVSNVDLKVNILGSDLMMPVGIAPTALQKVVHPDGELACAKAAGKGGCVYIQSTTSTSSIEEVAAAAPDTIKWFQTYIYKDRSLTESMARRAEKAGFKGIVLTVDTPVLGNRRSTMRNKFSIPSHLGLKNFTGLPAKDIDSLITYLVEQIDGSVTWDEVDWLANLTSLPVIVKGVLTKGDALLAVKHKCQGIIVSNHGGRQVDSFPATIEVLSEIVEAVGDKTVVMMDGGISQGSDVFKALALGAKMVFMGRPAIWGLAVGGQQGVQNILEIIRQDLEVTMALSGSAKVGDITREMVVHQSHYSKL